MLPNFVLAEIDTQYLAIAFSGEDGSELAEAFKEASLLQASLKERFRIVSKADGAASHGVDESDAPRVEGAGWGDGDACWAAV